MVFIAVYWFELEEFNTIIQGCGRSCAIHPEDTFLVGENVVFISKNL